MATDTRNNHCQYSTKGYGTKNNETTVATFKNNSGRIW